MKTLEKFKRAWRLKERALADLARAQRRPNARHAKWGSEAHRLLVLMDERGLRYKGSGDWLRARTFIRQSVRQPKRRRRTR